MTTPLDMIRGRSNVVTLTNNSGGGLVAGDVCIQDTSADEKVTTTTSAASVLKVFVAAETIANGAAGRFYESGYCPLVNVNASVTRGRFLFTHTVAKQAAENATYGAGAFGKILKSGTTPSAIIYSATAQTAGTGPYTQGARVYNSGNLSINDNTLTALTFNSERYDTDTIHDTGSNTGRLTCTTTGVYVIGGHVEWGAGSTGFRLVAIKLNNTTFIAVESHQAQSAGTNYNYISTVYSLTATNYVELWVQHTQGAPLNVTASGNFSPEFWMQRIG